MDKNVSDLKTELEEKVKGTGLKVESSGFTPQESCLVFWNTFKPNCSKWKGPEARVQSLLAKSLACAHQP